MRENLQQLMEIARGMWSFRWPAMATSWGIAVVGWAAIFIDVVPGTVPYYTASAQIYIDTETFLRPLLKGLTVEVNHSEQLGLIARQLMSRPNLEQVLSETGLGQSGTTQEPIGVALAKLKENIVLDAERPSKESVSTNFYEVSYTNKDPKLAEAVMQSLIDAFAKNTVAEIRRDADMAKLFMDKQIANYEEQLSASDARIRDFKRQHTDALPEMGQTYYERLQLEQAALKEIDLQIRQAESRRDELMEQIAHTPGFVRAVSADGIPVPTLSESRLTALEIELEQLLLKFTDAHPDVIKTRESIALLQRQQHTSPGSAPIMGNPIRQELELRLKDVEGDLVGLKTTREIYIFRLEELQQSVETLTEVEDELLRLNRIHETTMTNYESIVSRRQSMEISDSVEQDSGDRRFRVIEPPNVSVRTVLDAAWKIQFLLITVVLVASFTAGIALAFALSHLHPAIFGQRTLRELTGLPLFGVISQVSTFSMRLRRRLDLAAFATFGAMLVAAYGVSILAQQKTTYGTATSILDGVSKLLAGVGT